MFLIDVTGVKALPERRLELRFADGITGLVNVDAVVGQYDGIFSSLMEPVLFEQAHVDPELGTVVWPNGADLCPDVLYAHATGQQAKLPSAG